MGVIKKVAFLQFWNGERTAAVIFLSDGRASEPFTWKKRGRRLIDRARELGFIDEFEERALLQELQKLREEELPDGCEVVGEQSTTFLVTPNLDGTIERREVQYEDGFTTVPVEELLKEIGGQSNPSIN